MDSNMTTDAARVDLQYELEAFSVQRGVDAYHRALEEKGNGAVSAGSSLIKAAMKPMIEALEKWLKVTSEGLASRSASSYYMLQQVPVEAIAWVTANSAISMLHERPAVTRVAISIAMALEATINVDALLAEHPKLGKKVTKQVARMSRGSNRAMFIRRAGAMVDVKVVKWDDASRVRVGTLLLEMFAQETGLVALELSHAIRGKTQMQVRTTESCAKWLEASHARCALLSPPRLPMVCPPREWTNPFNGGYLSHAMRQPLVKTRNKGYLQTLKEHHMPWVYASVNALQGTEWSVNEGIYDTVKQLWEAASTLGGLPRRKEAEKPELPPKSWAEGETPTPEVLHAWKVSAAKAYEQDAKDESKRNQTSQKLWTAEMMLERGNRFHYVYNLDWRGRMYPVGAALTPQGDDVAKALLRFSRGMALGEDGAYWLAVHGANSRGVDKVSFEERIEWVQAHEADILASAADPYSTSSFWAAVDDQGKLKGSPFVFLAFCFEWAKLAKWVANGLPQEAFESRLPVAFDGSCNGLQNFSAMLRDPVGGAATGLVPTEKPADIYSEVARATQAVIDRDAADADCEWNAVAQRWVGKMTRKLAKRNTMTVPYGVTKRGMRDQLYQELTGSASAFRAEDAGYLAACNFEAIGNVVVAARLAMDWLREVAKVAASTALPVRWVTPAGFLAVQDYRDDVGETCDFTVLGRRFSLLLAKSGDKLSTRKQALGISPNFVHSLDAAHLMRTVLFCAQDGMTDFAMIHDSYGVHAGQSSRLRDNLREAFVAQYSQPVLENFRNEILEQLPPEMHQEVPEMPPMGDLDLELVKQSEYFFA